MLKSLKYKDNTLHVLDQRLLPHRVEWLCCADATCVAKAIREMAVRGAPAIGVAAAYGYLLAARAVAARGEGLDVESMQAAYRELAAARPTAVNLAWAVDHMLGIAQDERHNTADAIRKALLDEAQRLADADVATNKALATHGAELVKDGDTILHHCNTGMLATVDYGTALGVIRMAHEQGKRIHVLLDETRPRLQGSRLSAWECEQLGIPYDIIPDTAAGYFMRRGEVNLVLFGADRVAANGDVVNKIGSYQIAVLARENGIPCYSVFPTSTVDLTKRSGDDIPIEERPAEEVTDVTYEGRPIAPQGVRTANPAFDVTPHRYVTGIVTENGIAYAPLHLSLRKVMGVPLEI